MEIRLPENKPRTKIWERLGTVPVIIAFPEIFMALKTGVAEAQKYLIQTNHVFSAAVHPALRETDKAFWAPALFEQVLAIK